MAELVTSESRRYLHGIQNTIISDDDTGVAQNIIPSNSQLALVDQMEVDGTLTVYGDAYVTSSKNADSLSGVNHNAIAGRDVYAAHPASAVSLVPVGSVVATDMQSAVAELDAGKVASNPPLTPSTKTKITYDSKGLVTSGNDATASDIANVPYGGVVAVNVQDAINAVESHAASAQTAANTAQTAANNAATAATNAQTTANNAATAAANAQTAANNAASAAAYADRLARSGNNLIKNGNSEDPNPTGWEAAGVYDTTYDSYKAFTGSKVRRTVTGTSGSEYFYVTGEIPCAPGDQHVIEAMVRNISAVGDAHVGIRYIGPSGTTGWGDRGAKGTTNAWTRADCKGTAPAGTTYVSFFIEYENAGGAGALAYYDCLYAARKITTGVIAATGTRDATTYLRGDGVWAPGTVSLPSSGSFEGIKVTGVVAAAGASTCWLDAYNGGRIAVTGADSSSYGTFAIEQYSSDLSLYRRALLVSSEGDCYFSGPVQATTAILTGLKPALYFSSTGGDTKTGMIHKYGDYLYMGSTGVPSYASMDLSTGNTAFTGTLTAKTVATTGNITVGDGTAGSDLVINGAVGNDRGVFIYTNGSPRWQIYANTTAESGSNTGSNLGIIAYSDAGSLIDTCLNISRAAGGRITTPRPITTSNATASTTTTTGCATFAGGIGVAGQATLASARIVGNIGFYNTAPSAKPTVTGSRGGNAAIASLLTALANLGLITDSTTA